MKSQKVKNLSYLAKVEFSLQDTERKDLVVLPSGAEVLSVNLEIEDGFIGQASIGLDEQIEFFLSKTSSSSNQSAKVYTTQKKSIINAKVESGDENKKAILRVLYFLPSEILVEY